MIKKTVSIYKQRVHCITIPKLILDAMGLQKGDKLDMVYNADTQSTTFTKHIPTEEELKKQELPKDEQI